MLRGNGSRKFREKVNLFVTTNKDKNILHNVVIFLGFLD